MSVWLVLPSPCNHSNFFLPSCPRLMRTPGITNLRLARQVHKTLWILCIWHGSSHTAVIHFPKPCLSKELRWVLRRLISSWLQSTNQEYFRRWSQEITHSLKRGEPLLLTFQHINIFKDSLQLNIFFGCQLFFPGSFQHFKTSTCQQGSMAASCGQLRLHFSLGHMWLLL